ncbi:MAG: hypothetical protein AAFY56_20325 [Pseudomonadota bacterium]
MLAEVESVVLGEDDGPSTFTFVVKKTLQGRVRGVRFEYSGYGPDGDLGVNGDFDGHRDPDFWASPHGNSGLTGTCEIFGLFEVGKTYLMFLDGKPHFKAFENIQSDDDFWLSVVRAALAD